MKKKESVTNKSTEAPNTFPDFLAYPNEILLIILSFLEPHDLYLLLLVSKTYKTIAEDDQVWKTQITKRFNQPFQPSSGQTYKQLFREINEDYFKYKFSKDYPECILKIPTSITLKTIVIKSSFPKIKKSNTLLAEKISLDKLCLEGNYDDFKAINLNNSQLRSYDLNKAEKLQDIILLLTLALNNQSNSSAFGTTLNLLDWQQKIVLADHVFFTPGYFYIALNMLEFFDHEYDTNDPIKNGYYIYYLIDSLKKPSLSIEDKKNTERAIYFIMAYHASCFDRTYDPLKKPITSIIIENNHIDLINYLIEKNSIDIKTRPSSSPVLFRSYEKLHPIFDLLDKCSLDASNEDFGFYFNCIAQALYPNGLSYKNDDTKYKKELGYHILEMINNLLASIKENPSDDLIKKLSYIEELLPRIENNFIKKFKMNFLLLAITYDFTHIIDHIIEKFEINKHFNKEYINFKNNNDKTALHLAVTKTKADDLVKFLVAHIPVNAQDNDKNTALHCILTARQTSYITILTDELINKELPSADPTIPNRYGATALKLSKSVNEEVYKRLINHAKKLGKDVPNKEELKEAYTKQKNLIHQLSQDLAKAQARIAELEGKEKKNVEIQTDESSFKI